MMTKMMSRLRSPLGRALMIVVGTAGLAAALAFLLGPVAVWATPAAEALQGKDKADAVNATRQILLAAVGGLALLTGAAVTTRTFYLTKRGQLTDRYAKAIGLLASDKLAERLGGVYALDHLMVESEHDHTTVIEVLAAFIRDRTLSSGKDKQPWDAEHVHEGGDREPRVENDVQAALTVIGRRPTRPERNAVDLSRADLCGAKLSGLNFDGVWFWRAKLRSVIMLDTSLKRANLAWTQLQDATLSGAQMQGAFLQSAQLQQASLVGAQLQAADLTRARLEGSCLADANVEGANFSEAQLQGTNLLTYPIGKPRRPVSGLTRNQVSSAVIDDRTQLPDGLRDVPKQVDKRPAPDIASGVTGDSRITDQTQ